MDEDLNEAVDDIITQLKGNKKVAHVLEEEILDKDKLEDFLIEKSSKLINKSLKVSTACILVQILKLLQKSML